MILCVVEAPASSTLDNQDHRHGPLLRRPKSRPRRKDKRLSRRGAGERKDLLMIGHNKFRVLKSEVDRGSWQAVG